MISPLAARSAAAAVLLAILGACGCSTPTASLTTWRPAELEVAGIERLAVLQIPGPGETGNIAHSQLIAGLAQHRFYRLVDQAELDRVAPVSRSVGHDGRGVRSALEAGRRLGCDAILVGWMEFKGTSGSGLKGLGFKLGDPVIKAQLAFHIIDVPSGRVRLEDAVVTTFRGPIEGGTSDANSQPKIMQRLAGQCAQAAVAKLSPHTQSLDVPLAGLWLGSGAAAIRRGNRLAADGKWAEAQQQWQHVLRENPDSAAAAYNLGLAHQAHYDFRRAEQMYANARQQSDKEIYDEGLKRVEKAGRDYQLVAWQHEQRRRPQHAVRPSAGYPPQAGQRAGYARPNHNRMAPPRNNRPLPQQYPQQVSPRYNQQSAPRFQGYR